jgi:hypothetical protein
MAIDYQKKEAVLRIGQVIEVSGRRIFVRVDKNKNVSVDYWEKKIHAAQLHKNPYFNPLN